MTGAILRLLLAICTQLPTALTVNYPPPGQYSHGGVWPLPQNISYYSFNHTISPRSFKFSSTYQCDILLAAFSRYKELLFLKFEHVHFDNVITLSGIDVIVERSCPHDAPQFGMDESYKLEVPGYAGARALLKAREIWGAIRGLETFSQLLFFYVEKKQFRMRSVSVRDFPRFAHRGVLIDTSRHYLPVNAIKANIELMAENKFNVLHWHIVDDPSFPFQSSVFPKLSQKGAYTEKHVYTEQDVQAIIDYGRLRAIRILPEFDTPGHTMSWGNGQPDLLSDCYDRFGIKKGEKALIDITKESTWDFLLALFNEIAKVFPDHYIHLGGDEASYWTTDCWLNNPNVQHFMKIYDLNDTKAVENYYFQVLLKLVKRSRKNFKVLVWQEVVDNKVEVNEAIVHVWKGSTLTEQMAEIKSVTSQGHMAILSSCWYLDYISYLDFPKYYSCDPQAFEATEKQKRLVIGGEAALWGEMVDGANIIPRLWPRASAVAERLWSDPEKTKDVADAWPRMHEMRCRMVLRGYPAEPVNGPSYCPFFYENYTIY